MAEEEAEIGAVEVQLEYDVAEEGNGQYIKPFQSVRYCISIHSFLHLKNNVLFNLLLRYQPI